MKICSEKFRVTIIVDNSASSGLIKEHGFSVLIETDKQKILFDTGQGAALAPNAEKLSVNLSDIDMLVLSHGHYDHTGGIPALYQKQQNLKIYAHPAVLQPCFSFKDNRYKSVSMPSSSVSILAELSEEQINWCATPLPVTSSVRVTGAIPRGKVGNGCGQFFIDQLGFAPDYIESDMALWFETCAGLVIVTGCCHAGLVNTVEYVRYLNQNKHVHAIIGGFHLNNSSQHEVEALCEKIIEYDIEKIIPCHCTGTEAVKKMVEMLPGRVITGASGKAFDF